MYSEVKRDRKRAVYHRTLSPFQTHRISGDNRGWVDEYSIPSFSANVTSYIAISPLRDGAAGHFKHLVHVQIHGKHTLPLTHGKFEVMRIVHWDQLNNWVYYVGVPERLPGQQHLYRVSSIPPKFGIALKPPKCLTCPSAMAASSKAPSSAVDTTTSTPVKLGTSWDDDWEDDVIVTLPAQTTSSPSTQSSSKRRRPKGRLQY